LTTTNRNPLRFSGRPPLLPDRVRKIDAGGFAFIPNRFLRDGFFVSLSPMERSLYLLLVLAGDRQGVSFYHYDRLSSILELVIDDYIRARNALLDKDLIATDGTRIQVLSLPERPVLPPSRPLKSAEDLDQSDPATVRSLILDALHRDP
jgi:hypothetical protein